MHKINLTEKLAQFDIHWDPKVLASFNNNDVMVVKFQGEFPFHKHETTENFFLVLEGNVTMEYHGAAPVQFDPEELAAVPKGIVHRPRAEPEAKVLPIEPKGEPNSCDSGRVAAAKEHI